MQFNALLLICVLAIPWAECLSNCKPTIAVVGGGIGGASASHFLTELFKENLEIDLYEAEALGGRLSTVEVGDYEYESGGSIIHSQNKYMQEFVKLLGLEHTSETRDSNERSGIWNGKQFVFKESEWKVISLAKLFYRYGIQPLKLQRYISSILSDFEKIYDLQDAGKSFENVTALLSAMNSEFPKFLETSGRKHLLNLGYEEEFIDEVVQSAMIVNYGQNTDIHSFVVCVSLAALTGDLWAVEGGNKQVPEHLIYSNAYVHIVPSTVKKITLLSGEDRNKYEVYYSNEDGKNLMKSTYDIVILATPLTVDHERPIEYPSDSVVPGKYHTTVATFVKAQLNPSYFGLNEEIDNILSCNTNDSIISSVGRLSSVDSHADDADRNVWKIFSNAPLKQNVMDQMFSNVQEKKKILWKAYPEYSTNNRLDRFKFGDGLYHVNAIEWAASAMEMSAIGGRNVAILAHNDFVKACDKQEDVTPKTESTNENTRSTEL